MGIGRISHQNKNPENNPYLEFLPHSCVSFYRTWNKYWKFDLSNLILNFMLNCASLFVSLSKIQITILILSFSRTAKYPSSGPETLYWKFDLNNLILNLPLNCASSFVSLRIKTPSKVSLPSVYCRIFCHDDTVCSHFTQHRVRLKSLPQDV